MASIRLNDKDSQWLILSLGKFLQPFLFCFYSNSYSISVISVLETPILTLCMTDDDVLTVRCDELTTFVDIDSVV